MDPDLSFAFGDDPDSAWNEFWYGDAEPWFRGRGYSLFKPLPLRLCLSVDKKSLRLKEFPYPFAHLNAHEDQDLNRFLSLVYPMGTVAYGQDPEGHLIAFKFVQDSSEEYKCLQFIHSLELHETKDACLLPVLDFLQCDGHWFAVMPFWSPVYIPCNCKTLRDVLYIMKHVLKALSFLHKHKIFHRDIKLSKLLNYIPFHNREPFWLDPKYTSLQFSGQLLYSFIDFGVSIKFPENYSYEQCRLPYRESWYGTYRMMDTWQGEFDFDPFAYDVGVLGIVFSDTWQHLIPQAPMLAPLLDKMLTWKVRDRFTASEALQFLENMQASLTEKELSSSADIVPELSEFFECHDRWAGLPADFVAKWAMYRAPAMPYWMKFLPDACSMHPWILHSLAATRRSFYVVKLQLGSLRQHWKLV